MAKYCGAIGFAMPEETAPGVWTDQIVEKIYRGEVIRNFMKWQNSENLNDDLNISNELSVVGDPFLCCNCANIKYATYMGVKWKVNSIDIQYPRLKLSLGGVWNEQSS